MARPRSIWHGRRQAGLTGFFERNLKAWDIAAGIVLVREAGGYAGSLDGTGDVLETGDIVAGNEFAFSELKKRLAKVGG